MSGDGGSSNYGGKRSHAFNDTSFDGSFESDCWSGEEFLDGGVNSMSFAGGSASMTCYLMHFMENGKGDGGSSDWKNK